MVQQARVVSLLKWTDYFLKRIARRSLSKVILLGKQASSHMATRFTAYGSAIIASRNRWSTAFQAPDKLVAFTSEKGCPTLQEQILRYSNICEGKSAVLQNKYDHIWSVWKLLQSSRHFRKSQGIYYILPHNKFLSFGTVEFMLPAFMGTVLTGSS